MRRSLPLSIILISLSVLLLVWIIPEKGDDTAVNRLPNDWFFSQRAYPSGRINHAVYVESLKQSVNMKSSKKNETVWEFAGPYNIGGRITDVEFHEDSPHIFLGAASGGIFRITPDGSDWESVFDDALSLSIGDIAFAPSDPSVLYAGTGEANGGGGSQSYDGVGIYTSTDGGDSWIHKGLIESRNIGRIAVHPQDPAIAYVAAMGSLFGDSPDRGIFKTTDGGDTWEHVLYVSDSTGGIDIVINPDFPDIVYAALWERIRRPDRRSYGGSSCGIFKTIDGGENWNELSDGLPSPGNDVGRIGIDISNSDPEVLYAIYADKTGYFEGVYKTVNGGDSWVQTNDGVLENCFQSYGWWFGRIEADPVDPDIAYVIGFDVWKTTNSGSSWNNISENKTHVDQHGLAISPLDNDLLFLGNDGGFYLSDNGGSSWDFISTLPITQFYTCEIDNLLPSRLYGGTQDNGTNRTLTGNTTDWASIYGGDGFYVLVDPENNDYVYAEYQYGGLGRSTDGGSSFTWATSGIGSDDRKNWCTPVIFDPLNPQILYYGSNKLYKSVNRAESWTAISPDLTNGPGINLTYGTLTTIAVSPANTDLIYAGTDDGNVWVKEDAGSSWTLIKDGLPDCWVTRLAADPWEENTVYVTFSGYRWNEFVPHVFRSADKGQNWEDISSNLPEIPLNDIIIDPEDNQTLYVASDAGVFVSHNLGESWETMGSNLPLIAVNDLDLHNDTRKLVAATFGRSMYSYDLFQDTLATGIRNAEPANVLAEMKIYPNPVHPASVVRITSSHPFEYQLFILDLSGSKTGNVLDLKHNGVDQEIALATLGIPRMEPGVYLLVMETKDRILAERLVVGK